MTKSKLVYSLLLFFLFSISFAQGTAKVKFKKDKSLFYFFQQGAKNDTVYKDKNHVFYLIVPDSLKNLLSFQVENGQLLPTENDSLVRLSYVSGMKYESFYEEQEKKSSKKAPVEFEFRTLVNGIAENKDRILIQVVNKKESKIVLENVFVYGE